MKDRIPAEEHQRAVQVARAQTEALVTTLRALARNSSLDTYVGEVLMALTEQLGERSGSVWLRDERGGALRLHLEYSDGVLKPAAESDHPGAALSPPNAAYFAERASVPTVYDVDASPELEGYREFHQSRGIRSLLVVPMIFGDQVIGTFSVRSPRRSTFTADEIELAQVLAHQATLALQLTRLAEESRRAAVSREQERAAEERAATLAAANAALEREIQERTRVEAALRRSEEALTRTLAILATEPPLDTFLGHVLGTVTEQLSAPASTLWFYDADLHAFLIHMSYTEGQVVLGQLEGTGPQGPTRLPDDRADLQELLRTRHTVVLNDLLHNPHLEEQRAWLKSRGVKAALLVPLVVGDTVIGVIGVHNTARDFWSPEERDLAEALAGQASLAVQLTRLADQVRRAAVVEERNRMAREIHDTLAQGLTGIVVQLEAAEDWLEDSIEGARKHLAAARSLARESLQEARRSVHALRPLALETADLSEALSRMAERLGGRSGAAGARILFSLAGTARPLPSEISDNLHRSAQESLANALKHSGATEIRLSLCFGRDQVTLTVEDNGCGFDPGSAWGGLGLTNLRERAERIRGALDLQSTPGTGTRVSVRVPVPPGEASARHDRH